MLRFLAALAMALASVVANAGPTQLLKDINRTVWIGAPQPFGSSWIAMGCVTRATGNVCNPWITDGTAAGTHIITSKVSPDLAPQSVGPIVVAGTNAFFLTQRNPGGTTLWRTDGTDAGTVALGSFPLATDVNSLAAANGLVFFNTSGTGTLWRSDGTPAGTYAVVASGVGSGSWVAAGDRVYFGHSDINGYELWMTDGSSAGTMVKDVSPGSFNGLVSIVGYGAGRVFFFARTSDLATPALWSSDGTDAGTTQISTVSPPSSKTPFVAFNGNKVALLNYANNATGLVVSDGTAAGTQVVAQFAGVPQLDSLSAAGPALFFLIVNNNLGTLWRSDGTLAGTSTVQYDVLPPAFSFLRATATDTDYYFAPIDNRGTAANVYKVSSTGATNAVTLASGYQVSPIGVANGYLFLGNLVLSLATPNASPQPWQAADGQPSNGSSCGTATAVLAGALYFAANDGVSLSCQIWKTDGTPAGTVQVTSSASNFTFGGIVRAAGPYVYFLLQPGLPPNMIGTVQLWRTDGTTVQFVQDQGVSTRRGFVNVNGSLVFGLDGDVWRVDPASPNPVRVATGFSFATVLTGDAAGAYFYAQPLTSAAQLYRYDEVNGLTSTPTNLNQSLGFAAAANILVYPAAPIYNGAPWTLWRSDGTPAGTYSILNGSPSTPITMLGAVGPRVFFTMNGYLWRTDGSASGTVALAQLTVQQGWASNDQALWFSALPNGTGNPALYRVGPFDPGVTLLGPGGQMFLTPIGAYGAVMLNPDAAHGYEFWLSRGDPPSLIEDFEPGTDSNYIAYQSGNQFRPVALGNDKVIFMTSHNGSGWEPYVIDIPAPGPAAAMLDRVDFDGNHDADLVLRQGDGSVQVRTMSGTSALASSAGMLGVNGATGRVMSTAGDFNGDGKADLLFQRDDGGIEMWLMNGTNRLQATLIMVASNWSIAHVADFDGDGKSDILWKNTDGSVSLWLMDGVTPRERGMILAPGSGWVPEHVGDFNGDGRADILWRNGDGSIAMWLMYGLAVLEHGGIMPAATGWDVLHVADFDGDGKSDLLWQHTAGSVSIWTMNGLGVVTHAPIMAANTSWTVTHVADFNGDGKADLVWLARDGTVGMWLMNGTTQLERRTLMPAGTGWTVTLAQDLDGDNKADLVWSHPSGAVGGWIMNGTTNVSHTPLEPSGSTSTVVPLRFQH